MRKNDSGKDQNIESLIRWYLYHLEMILKCPVNITLKFLNASLYFLLYIFIADTKTFSKLYKHVYFV